MRCAALLLALTLTAPALAQTTLTGRVVDAETGTPLAAATVQVEGTYTGTITNAEGRFELNVPGFPTVLAVRYIGYATERTALAGPPLGDLAVRMRPVTVEMAGIEVTGENPAIAIMRRVIERKQQWRAGLNQYQADAYNRFTLRNDTGIVSIIESLTEVYWVRDEGLREVVKARRTTANLHLQEYLPAAAFVLNLYDDNIDIAGHTLIGVTHPDALDAYAFTLEGTRMRDDELIYDIGVRPKNRLISGFVGRVAILAEAYAMVEAELTPGKAFYFPRPIERFETTYRQQFSNFGGEAWLPVDLRSQTAVKIRLGFLLDFPAFHVDQVSRLTDYELDVTVPDSLFADDDRLAVDSAAVAADTLLDTRGVAVPLSEPERVAYAGIDSTMTLEEAFKPKGALASQIDFEDDEEEDEGWGPLDRLGLDVTPRVWYNRVEEGHLGLRLSRWIGPVRLAGEAGYQTGPAETNWTYGGAAEVRLTGRTRVDASYRYGVDPAFTSSLFDPIFSSVALLLGADDYFDYGRVERLRGGIRHEVRGLPLTIAAGGRVERHEAVAKTTDYDLLGDPEPFRANPAVDEGLLRSATLHLALGDELIPGALAGGNRLVLNLEAADPSVLGGDFSFVRVQAVANVRLKPYLSRRLIPPTLDIRLAAGINGGTLPFQRAFTLDGSLSGSLVGLTPFGGLRTREGRPYLGDRYAAVFWEHSLRAIPFELLGLYGIAHRGYNIILQGAHGRTWLDDAHAGDPRYAGLVPDGWHHELGVSFSGLLGVLRLDFTWRLDAPGFTLGLSTARIF